MKKAFRVFLPLLLLALLLLLRLPGQLADTSAAPQEQTQSAADSLTLAPETEPGARSESAASLDEDGEYASAEEVALYLHTYGRLPSNYITKQEAEALGWTGGSLEPYAPGKMLGGTWFGNYDGLLPAAKGRSWHECDVNNRGLKSRGPERLVYSNDGLIYYTADHYESFTLLYGEP